MEFYISVLAVCIIIFITMWGVERKNIKKLKRDKDKFVKLYNTCTKWLENVLIQKNLKSYFIKNNYYHIAIYGMGTLGELLYKDIHGEGEVRVEYFIDTLVDGTWFMEEQIEVIGPDSVDKLNKVDVIIVTPFTEYASVEQQLKQRGITSDIVSLRDVINMVGDEK